jgi:hypothetical protein
MPNITNAGAYRGTVLEHGISETTNGFPQLCLKMQGVEYYDDATNEWVGLEDKPDAIAYLVLVDSKGEKTLNCKQIEKVFEWDGCSLVELEAAALEGKPIQFRAAFRKYNEQDRLGVEWIDAYDADPVRGVKKLDADGVKAIQGKFGSVFSGKAKTPVASAKSGAKPPTKPATAKATTTKTVTPPPASTLKPEIKLPVRQPTKPAVETGKCTREEAFAYVSNQELWKKGTTEQQLSETWLKVVNEIAGDRADEEITPEEWYTIQGKVAHEIFVF